MTKEKGTLIKVDGIPRIVYPHNRKKFDLKELQSFVGGNIELAKTRDNQDMYINEEGKLKELPVNHAATEIYKYGEHEFIVGDVIIVEKEKKMTEEEALEIRAEEYRQEKEEDNY